MIPLNEALESINSRSKPSVLKYLKLVGITKWEDIDKWHLMLFSNRVKESMSASSAHTTFAVFKAFLAKFEDELDLPKDWRELLKSRADRPMKTYLTAEEVERFGSVYVDSPTERTVRDGFYISCKTGLRFSDLAKLQPSNFQPRKEGGYYLNYVSKKTRIQSTILCSEDTKQRIDWIHYHGRPVTLRYYNSLVRELAQRADIDTIVSVYQGGKELEGPKWKFISSHSARISFCTILADLGTDIVDIMRLAGHTNPTMSARYIVRHEVKINPKVEQFLM